MNRDYRRIKRPDNIVCKECGFFYVPERSNPEYDSIMFVLNNICKSCIASGEDEYSMFLSLDSFDTIAKEKSKSLRRISEDYKSLNLYYKDVQEYAHNKQVDIEVERAKDKREIENER